MTQVHNPQIRFGGSGVPQIKFAIRCNPTRLLLSIFLLLVAGLANPTASSPQSLDKVRVGLPDFSISFLPLRVAQTQRLYQSEGVEVELIRISNPVAMIALMNKEIDYAVSTGSVLASAIRGLPLKVVMYALRTPLHALLVKPEIKAVQEIRGKVIGVATGTTEAILRAIMVHARLTEPDVKILLISESSSRLNALSLGRTDGAILPPPFSVQGEKMGLRRLISASEVPEIIDARIAFPPPAGLGVHNDKLQRQPEQIRQLIRATLKAHEFIRTRKEETVKIISDWLKVDSAIALGSYDAYLSSLNPEGWVPDAFMRAVIEQQRQSLKVAEKVPVDKVADFTILKETLAALHKGR
jgi:ABC-type nitrate/sulfonate/bicarbonate transport system substrate-binding protein